MDQTIEGKIYLNGRFEEGCIGIKDGKITAIKKILKGDEHYSFSHQLILPAAIDLHVHFREPGFTYKEDFYTGSKAAAYGGISCFFDMPNTNPPTTHTNNVLEKIRYASKKSFVDYGIYAGIIDNNIDEAKKLSEYCNGFKIYLGDTTGSLQLDEQKLGDVLEEISSLNRPVLIHAESNKCLQQHRITEDNLQDHIRSRPAECEENAIRNILLSSKTTKKPLKIHICHLSSCEGFEILKKHPPNITIGVTPHHLLLNIEKISKRYQTHYKVNPPIRTNLDQETLWYGIQKGFIDILESDHAPHTLQDKEAEFMDAPAGVPGAETMLPLFLAEVKRNNLSLKKLVSMLCEKPADLTGVPKGRIEIGRDADLIIVDLKEEIKNIRAEHLHSKCGWTPFEGMKALFPKHLFVRGEIVIEDHALVGAPGHGKHIQPSQYIRM
ncbi:MAG: hypothetical protein DRN05_02005 [Thermoplasmata archaeon]|nr:MAG: hypothetical protein DRN05_02005 [Thermoplasmata archaeon]